MKATGIVRRIDDLGRVVIPKEIRRTLRIREGDPLEIFTSNDGEVIFKKYSPIGDLSAFAGQYAEILHKSYIYGPQGGALLYPGEGIARPALGEYPLISAGDVCGSILFLADGEPTVPTEAEEKLLQAAAGFLGKQMEE